MQRCSDELFNFLRGCLKKSPTDEQRGMFRGDLEGTGTRSESLFENFELVPARLLKTADPSKSHDYSVQLTCQLISGILTH